MIVIAVLMIVFFSLAFITKRRFGVLAPALIMGYFLQQLWQSDLPAWARMIGLPTDFLIAPVTMLGLVLILLPAVILLFGGPVYKSKRGQICGSIGCAVLAAVLCANPLVNSMVLGGGEVVANFIDNGKYIITAAAGFAIVDMFYVHVGVPGKSKTAKH